MAYLSFQREYAERYDWLARQFKDLAFSFYSSFLYYNDYDVLDEKLFSSGRLMVTLLGILSRSMTLADMPSPMSQI